jgi:hypothetical protein
VLFGVGGRTPPRCPGDIKSTGRVARSACSSFVWRCLVRQGIVAVKSVWSFTLSFSALLLASNSAVFGGPVTLVWSRTYTGQGSAVGYGVTVTPEGVYVTGDTRPSGGQPDVFLLKYDLAGNLVWSRTWGGGADEYGRGVSASSSHVYAAGSTRSYAYDPSGDLELDAVTVKWTHDGVLDCSNSANCWFTRFSGDAGYYGSDGASDVAHDGDGSFYVVGSSEHGWGNRWAYVEKYDATGLKQWHQHYGTSGAYNYFTARGEFSSACVEACERWNLGLVPPLGGAWRGILRAGHRRGGKRHLRDRLPLPHR